MQDEKQPRPQVIVCDVFATLLDMAYVERRVNYLTDSKRGYRLWFEQFMEYCFVANSTGQFHEFSDIARATMQMTGKALGKNLSNDGINDALELLHHLPVHEDVPGILSRLHDMGFRLAALTNTPRSMVIDRMERTGLISYFEQVLSAAQIKKYKPAREVYEWAATKLGVPVKETLLVSVHGWDVAGAAHAGMQTAFIQRGSQMLYPLAPKPDYVCKSLAELALQLDAIETP